ncbi:F-box/LRR-repeat protein At3g26922-like [Lactuca sativa]|uniref:F-box/LRR-repeat protein At3g26922 n=2 Tax=Lactuca sativa TaxID=4236 RepID=UPI000CB42F09|nr:F-box/LRR-repeat protein At3g26922 [Lactuca sativa]XP_023749780.1 F-box/LRR-repeat protein At3g26922-like [Lactuca sativa]XP_052625741.1 F-box/LRR-repeat protein At3g26922-like [Lactuca sativa]XP_052625742.1 F-box/LRR-repeat protein At3g26922-like [Lactuca sativa]
MATKRKVREQEPVNIENKKKAKMEDRLSDLPECLQLHILTSLDAKHAVQTSVLSRTWVSAHTRIPVLEFNSYSFKKLLVFDKFVCDVLRHRDHSAKLERLTFNRSGSCSAKILNSVFDYAFSLGVEQLSVNLQQSRNKTWPVFPVIASFESLKSLTLESQSHMICPYLGPISRSFKSLTTMHLQHALIKDPDPFSGFPMLESLTLEDCHLCMESEKTLRIHALRLTDLTISSLWNISCCEVTTPRLKFFDYKGHNFHLLLPTHEGLPVLEKVVIDFNGLCYRRQEKLMFDDLMAMFYTMKNVKSLTLCSSIVQLLSFFPDELVRRSSPFRELKELKMDFRNLLWQNLFERISVRSKETFQVPLDVKTYLLKNSPDAKFSFTYPIDLK